MSCDTSQKMKKVRCMATADFMFPASQISRENERHFRARPSFSKQKIYDSDELLADLQVDDVWLSVEPQMSFNNLF